MFDRPPVRRIFHWQFSGVLIPAFVGLAGTMISLGVGLDDFDLAFVLADLFLVGALIWALGYWLTSDSLQKWRPTLRGNRKRRREIEGKRTWFRFHVCKFGVSALIIAFFFGSIALTSTTRLKHELSRYSGVLVPANDSTPSNPCGTVPRGALLVILGERAAWTRQFPTTVLRIGNDDILVLDRDGKGNIVITTDIYDGDNIVASIDRNNFTVTSDAFTKERNDLSSLAVTLRRKKEKVLDVRYLNPSTIRILGIFRHPGQPELKVTPENLVFNGKVLNVFGVCLGVQPGARLNTLFGF